MKKLKLKINNVFGFKKDQSVEINTSDTGIPVDQFWRRRIADSKMDNCLEIIKNEKPSKKEKAK